MCNSMFGRQILWWMAHLDVARVLHSLVKIAQYLSNSSALRCNQWPTLTPQFWTVFEGFDPHKGLFSLEAPKHCLAHAAFFFLVRSLSIVDFCQAKPTFCIENSRRRLCPCSHIQASLLENFHLNNLQLLLSCSLIVWPFSKTTLELRDAFFDLTCWFPRSPNSTSLLCIVIYLYLCTRADQFIITIPQILPP